MMRNGFFPQLRASTPHRWQRVLLWVAVEPKAGTITFGAAADLQNRALARAGAPIYNKTLTHPELRKNAQHCSKADHKGGTQINFATSFVAELPAKCVPLQTHNVKKQVRNAKTNKNAKSWQNVPKRTNFEYMCE